MLVMKSHPTVSSTTPLVVDVDGTLVAGDLLVEGAARLLAASPLTLFALPIWLVKGRAALKRRIAAAVALPPSSLVLNPAVLDEIAAAKATGRTVWLASAADELMVAPLADTLEVTGYLASDGRINLAGRAKADALVERFGEGGFDYIGNERRDLVVWKRARRAIGVGLSASLAGRMRALDKQARLLPGTGAGPLDWLLALRPRHWVKNSLVFAPLVAAHETRPELYLIAAVLFTALAAAASGNYLLNDLLDLPDDRRHASKRHRPLAAGKLPPLPAIGVGSALAAGGLAAVFWLSAAAGFWVLFYLVLAFAYSLWLKRQLFVDVVTLAMLFTIRILAGAAVVSIPMSPWFLAFSIFLFLGLAIVKRLQELHAIQETGRFAANSRAYLTGDRLVLAALGAASSFASIVVLALYIQAPEVDRHYARPEFLWLTCVLLICWQGRITLLANRGAIDDDPVVFAMRDRASWLIGLGVLAAFAVAL